MTFDLL